MRLLLDTHVFLWAIGGSRSLKSASRRVMEEADHVYVSAASILGNCNQDEAGQNRGQLRAAATNERALTSGTQICTGRSP